MLQCFQITAAVIAKLKAYSPLASSAQIYGFEPSDGFVDATTMKPHVFVYFSTSDFSRGNGSENADQQHDPVFFADVYGFGRAKAAGAVNNGLSSAESAAISAETIFSHVYDVIMDMRRKSDSFGRDVAIGGRYVRRIEAFPPPPVKDSDIGVKVIRMEFSVSVVETPPGETDGPDLSAQGIEIITPEFPEET